MVKVEGREKLRRKFAALPKAVREEMMGALVKSAEDLTGMQKRLAPVKTGKLRDSIKYEIENDGMTAIVTAGDKEAFYAAMVEHGTKAHVAGGRFAGAEIPAMPARPFFFPAFRALKKSIKSRASRAVTKGIKKIARG